MPSRPKDREKAEQIKRMIGSRLREARTRRGWTQELAAERLDLAVESYARIERGTSFPSFPTLLAIAKELEVRPDVLLGLDEEKAGQLTEKEQAIDRIVAGLRGLDDQLVPVVEQLVRGLRGVQPKAKTGPANLFKVLSET